MVSGRLARALWVARSWRLGSGMKPLFRARHIARRAAQASLLAVLLVAPTRATEVATGGVSTSDRIVIHDAQETLRDWCRPDSQGTLWLMLPGGMRFELVTPQRIPPSRITATGPSTPSTPTKCAPRWPR